MCYCVQAEFSSIEAEFSPVEGTITTQEVTLFNYTCIYIYIYY